jgi:hypothetical protein
MKRSKMLEIIVNEFYARHMFDCEGQEDAQDVAELVLSIVEKEKMLPPIIEEKSFQASGKWYWMQFPGWEPE